MKEKKKPLAARLTRNVLLWSAAIIIVFAYVIIRLEKQATQQFYTEIYHHKMLVSYEYTRRVISDVYVAVTNNIYYIEQTLDDPDAHVNTMERIVRSGTRVRSCGLSFIKDYYYPRAGHKYCPYAWRSLADQDVIWKENLGDASLDYFDSKWFLDVLHSDSAQWSEPFYDGLDKKTTLSAYMAPIHDSTGRIVAVLGADVSLDWLTGKLGEIDSTMNKDGLAMANMMGLRSKSFIINHDGTFITHDDNQLIMKGNFFHQLQSSQGSDVRQLAANIKQGIMPESGKRDKFLVDGEECYVFYTPVKYTKWVIVSVVPCYAIDMLGYLNAAVILLLLLLAMLVIAAVCYFYAKASMQPVRHLTHAVNDISRGNYSAPMPEMKHHDEICDLRDAIEKMQYSIANYADQHQTEQEDKQ